MRSCGIATAGLCIGVPMIVGIIAAIAIPQFAAHRRRNYDTAVSEVGG